MRNPERKFGCAFIIVWGIAALASLAVSVGIVFVAIHFISKWW